MRDIKFRLWDTKADNPQGPGLKGVMICDEWLKNHPSKFAYCIKNNGADIFLMRYTELKDKNGVEIYEDDIVEWSSEIDNDMYGGPIQTIHEPVEFKGGAFYPVCMMPTTEFEVIGNIHEHLELL